MNGNGENTHENGNGESPVPTPKPARKKTGRTSTLRKLSEAQYGEYLQRVRLGSFPHIAAGSLGITRVTWNTWMVRGEREKSGIYRRFFLDTMEQADQARMLAEAEVRQSDPKFWLTRGPGKKDWSERSEISIDGNLAVEQRQGEAELKISQQHAMAQMLHAMAELGYMSVTPEGQQFLLPGKSGTNGDGEVTEDDLDE